MAQGKGNSVFTIAVALIVQKILPFFISLILLPYFNCALMGISDVEIDFLGPSLLTADPAELDKHTVSTSCG